jgi:hypothetical protein
MRVNLACITSALIIISGCGGGGSASNSLSLGNDDLTFRGNVNYGSASSRGQLAGTWQVTKIQFGENTYTCPSDSCGESTRYVFRSNGSFDIIYGDSPGSISLERYNTDNFAILVASGEDKNFNGVVDESEISPDSLEDNIVLEDNNNSDSYRVIFTTNRNSDTFSFSIEATNKTTNKIINAGYTLTKI